MKQFAELFMLAFWAVFGAVTPSQSEMVDRVVAVVSGEVITLSMVEDAMNAIWIDPQNIPKSQQDALQRLIDHKLKLQEARRLGVTVSEESLSRELAKVASRFASPEGFAEALLQRGITQEDLEESLMEEIMVQDMVTRKFRLFVEVPEIEVSAFFQQHREEFVMSEAVHLKRIFFQLAPDADEAAKENVKREAGAIIEELKSGADFSKYVSEEEMADYVSVDRLFPVVAAAISSLEIGEISDLIETPIGYFIIKLDGRRPVQQAAFDEVREEIKARLLQQKTEAELENWLRIQRDGGDVRIRK